MGASLTYLSIYYRKYADAILKRLVRLGTVEPNQEFSARDLCMAGNYSV
jgi:hypothetical protein